jgi:DNA binding domain, excisionase family
MSEEHKRQLKEDLIAKIPEGRDYISISEAEAIFGVSKDTIRRLIRSGQVPSINLGTRLTRVSKTDLMTRLPLRETPIEHSKPLPKTYSLEPDDCYSIGEIANKFGLSEGSVYRHIREYSIPTRQIGKYVYAPKSEIDRIYKDIVKL